MCVCVYAIQCRNGKEGAVMNAVYSGNDREDDGNDARATAKKKGKRERERNILRPF